MTWLLAVNCGVNSFYKGFLNPLLPLFIDRFDLTMATAGALASAFQIPASLGQLLWGWTGDQLLGRRWLLVLGPGAVAITVSLVGLVPNKTILWPALALAGFASAVYPPQASAIIGRLEDPAKPGLGLSMCWTFGVMGIASSPLVVVPLVTSLGLERLYPTALLGIVSSVILARFASVTTAGNGEVQQGVAGSATGKEWRRLMCVLVVISVLRAMASTAFGTFVAVLRYQQGDRLFDASTTWSVYMAAGAVGAAGGPRLAARWGMRTLMFVSLVVLPFLFWGFLYTAGLLSLLFLGLAGVTFYSSVTLNQALVIKLMPEHAGTASALTAGFAWGIGAISAIGVGAVADHFGLATALVVVACAPLLAAVLVPLLPSVRGGRPLAQG